MKKFSNSAHWKHRMWLYVFEKATCTSSWYCTRWHNLMRTGVFALSSALGIHPTEARFNIYIAINFPQIVSQSRHPSCKNIPMTWKAALIVIVLWIIIICLIRLYYIEHLIAYVSSWSTVIRFMFTFHVIINVSIFYKQREKTK